VTARDWTLAVDFGTSNTAAAHTGPVSGDVETLPLTHTGATMASSVFVDPANGHVDLGGVALDRAEARPTGFVPAPKRHVATGTVTVDGVEVPVAHLVAAVLGAVLSRARAAHGDTAPSRLVLTHPEAWLPHQIGVLRDAAGRLGLPPATEITTISEPRAAAHHYTRAQALAEGRHIAVFDFGGGTLDVAVLRADSRGGFEVVAARGDNTLGGKTFDSTIRRWVEEQLDDNEPDQLEWLRLRAPMDAHLALDQSISRAKELLSEAQSATITVPAEAGRTQLQLTRAEFEELIAPALHSAAGLTEATLVDAGLTGPEQLEALYLTGGSSRIPSVHAALGRFGRIATLDDPKTVVARGAIAALRGRGDDTARMPSGGGAPGSGPLAARGGSAGGGLRRRWPVVAAAAAAVVALAGGGVYALTSGGGGSDGGTAAPQADQSTGGQPQAQSGVQKATDKEAVLAGLPDSLRSGLTRCDTSGETDTGGLQLSCSLVKDSPLFQGIVPPDGMAGATVSVDPDDAKQKVVALRKGIGASPNATTADLVENSSRTAAGLVSGPDHSGHFDVDYSNSLTGITLSLFGASSADTAKTFLSRSGLIS